MNWIFWALLSMNTLWHDAKLADDIIIHFCAAEMAASKGEK